MTSTAYGPPDNALGVRPQPGLDVTIAAEDEADRRRAAAVVEGAGVRATVRALKGPPESEAAPDVVVLWTGRGIMARDAGIRRLRAAWPDARVVVVGPADSPAAVRSAVQAGAHGLVFTPQVDEALVPTVLAACAGQVCVPSPHRLALGTPVLTGREREVLRMVVAGMPNKEISRRLYLADSTVKSHLSSVFDKLGVRSRHEAVATVAEQRLNLAPGAGHLEEAPPLAAEASGPRPRR